MSEPIVLDPKMTAQWEPHEGDASNASWISPFDVPQSVFVGHHNEDEGAILAVRFGYPGGETGMALLPLDNHTDPLVTIKTGRHSGKILELTFSPPITMKEFARIGERIGMAAPRQPRQSAQFNFEMVSKILRNWPNLMRLRSSP